MASKSEYPGEVVLDKGEKTGACSTTWWVLVCSKPPEKEHSIQRTLRIQNTMFVVTRKMRQVSKHFRWKKGGLDLNEAIFWKKKWYNFYWTEINFINNLISQEYVWIAIWGSQKVFY